jgi:hypothetical protein
MRYDLTGKTFGSLTASHPAPNRGDATAWNCRCVCGSPYIARTTSLINGRTSSCGCLTSKRLQNARTTHGQSKKNKTGAYVSWTAMKWRCRTFSFPTYFSYRCRGITYCERWESFEAFLEDMGPRPKGKSLDRVDNDLGYSKENCRWATPSEQSQNRRNVKAAHARKHR